MSIAEKLFDVLSTAKGTEKGEASPKQEYCLQMANDCMTYKQKLIEVLSRHPNWDADNLRIHFTKTFERPQNLTNAHSALIDLGSYLADCFVDVEVSDENNENKAKLYLLGRELRDSMSVDEVFMSTSGVTADGVNMILGLRGGWYYGGVTTDRIDVSLSDAHIHEGTKCTKALMKLLRQYKFDKVLDADEQHELLRRYSVYADTMNPISFTRHTVLSVNPVDFLLMSNGNSWSSCHTIYPRRSVGSSYDGCYCGGCASYAYDHVSMIYYTVDSGVPDDGITDAGKITRQLHFYNGDVLMACRCYPQNSDGADYAAGKAAVQEIIAQCLGRPNLWRETDYRIDSKGYQYPDYSNFGPYKAYRLSDIPDNERKAWGRGDMAEGDINMHYWMAENWRSPLDIGAANVICTSCGGTLDDAEYPFCSDCCDIDRDYCSNCGCRIDYDEGYTMDNGDRLCDACYDALGEYCEDCDGYYYKDDMTWVDSEEKYVCDYCLDHYYSWCEHCEQYFYRDNVSFYIVDGEQWCQDCVDEDAVYCANCEKYTNADEAIYDNDGNAYCPNCVSDGVVRQCETCGEYFLENDMVEIDGKWYCEDHAAELQEPEVLVHELIPLTVDNAIEHGLFVCKDTVPRSEAVHIKDDLYVSADKFNEYKTIIKDLERIED